MSSSTPPGWVYNETVKMFATPGHPPVEDTAELERYWGRVVSGNYKDASGFRARSFLIPPTPEEKKE